MRINNINTNISFILSAVILLTLTNCAERKNDMSSEKQETHWSYEGKTGPDNWSDLNDEYYACAEGKNQSPINIDTDNVIKVDLPDIEFHYQPSTIRLINNGHTIQANIKTENYIEVKGAKYDLVQFHFHSLSEHTINCEHFPIEAHFVHKSVTGELAVIGVFIEDGSENNIYKMIWNNLPKNKDDEIDLSGTINIADMFPAKKETYRYSGSLTTPPCSEGVSWFVMKEPVQMSTAQIDAFKEIYNNNYRPILPANAREVLADLK
jgi:carbonic anhydrase